MEIPNIEQKRKYPRKAFKKPISYLCRGFTEVATGVEIGEGGLSIETDMVLDINQQVVLNFFVPGGHFFCMRATLKNQIPNSNNKFVYGLSFDEVDISLKRQIRAYVARISNSQKNH